MSVAVTQINNQNSAVNYDYRVWIWVVGAATTRTATLPAAETGYELYIKLSAASGLLGNLDVTAASGQTIDGIATRRLGLLSGTGGSLHLVAYNNNWVILSAQGLLI